MKVDACIMSDALDENKTVNQGPPARAFCMHDVQHCLGNMPDLSDNCVVLMHEHATLCVKNLSF
jgi:hypothetical protein